VVRHAEPDGDPAEQGVAGDGLLITRDEADPVLAQPVPLEYSIVRLTCMLAKSWTL